MPNPLLDRITIDPDQCSGKPCIRHMRIRVVDVLGWLAGGMSYEEILEDFDELELADIHASLAYAREHLAPEPVAA